MAETPMDGKLVTSTTSEGEAKPTYQELLDKTKKAAEMRKVAEANRLKLLERKEKEAARWHYQEKERARLTEAHKSFTQEKNRMLSRDGVTAVAELPHADTVDLHKAEVELACQKARDATRELSEIKEKWRVHEITQRNSAWQEAQRQHRQKVRDEKRQAKEQWRQVEEDTRRKAQERATAEAIEAQRNRQMGQARLEQQAEQYRAEEKARELERQRSLDAQAKLIAKHQRLAMMARKQMREKGHEIEGDRRAEMLDKRNTELEAERQREEWRRTTGARKREALKAKVAADAHAKALSDAAAKARFQDALNQMKEREEQKKKDERKAIKQMARNERQLKEIAAKHQQTAKDSQAVASKRYFEMFNEETAAAVEKARLGDDLQKQLATQQARDRAAYEQKERDWNARAQAERDAAERARREREFQQKAQELKMQRGLFKKLKKEQDAVLASRLQREALDSSMLKSIANEEKLRIMERNEKELREAEAAAEAEKRRKAKEYNTDMGRRFKKLDEKAAEQKQEKKLMDEIWKDNNEHREKREHAEKQALLDAKLLFRNRARLKSKEDRLIRQRQKLDQEIVKAEKAVSEARAVEEELNMWTERADTATKELEESRKQMQLWGGTEGQSSTKWFGIF